MQRLMLLPAGRRSKWAVLAVWLLVAGGFGVVAGKLHDATTNNAQAFLPRSAPSTEVAAIMASEFPRSVDEAPALIVYQRDGGLTPADRSAIQSDVAALRKPGVLRGVGSITSPFGPGGIVSPNGTTAVAVVDIDSTDIAVVKPAVETIRDIVEKSPPPGLTVHVTGAAGLEVDSFDILGNLDGTLLVATTVLILVLLIAIYRAPLVAVFPLVVVGIAYAVAAGAVYLLIESLDLLVSSQATSLLIILMFGAGTDYCIYLVARYREELREVEDPHEAMERALRHTTPAIHSCGLTVAGAMLVLLVAELESTRNAGPVLAVGIGVMMIAGLTLLPALLTILGRTVFWPAKPKAGTAAKTGTGLYHRIGSFVVRRPVAVLATCLVVLGVMAGGSAIHLGNISIFEGFREKTDAILGQEALARALPPGEAAPTTVIVRAPRASLQDDAERVARELARVDGVASAEVGAVSSRGSTAEVTVVLDRDPYADAATDLVPELRRVADRAVAGTGAQALVGGPTAAEYDTIRTIDRDFTLILPIALSLIFVILVGLLRALVAPLYLIATVVLSFFATLGLTYFCFDKLFDSGGGTAGYSTFLFIFLVALGVDYNIFLMSRIREEAARRPTREAVLHGLETTGGVITSAGLILAGTFATLMILPIEQLFQLGFGIAVGVLLDTFVVRTLLVPAITDLAGERAWWPSRLGGGRPAAILAKASGRRPAHIERG